jgi:UDP-glucose 4-epimerase
VQILGGTTIHVAKRPGEPDCTCADTRKIRRDLGWEPQVSFEEGLTRLCDRIDEWRGAPVWNTEAIEKATDTWFRMLAS